MVAGPAQQSFSSEIFGVNQIPARALRIRDGYQQFQRARALGRLSARIRVQIGLAVAQATLCEACLVKYTRQARRLGLTDREITASRESRAADPKTAAALEFARYVIAWGSEESTSTLIAAGYDPSEISEIVANVGFHLISCCCDLVAGPARS